MLYLCFIWNYIHPSIQAAELYTCNAKWHCCLLFLTSKWSFFSNASNSWIEFRCRLFLQTWKYRQYQGGPLFTFSFPRRQSSGRNEAPMTFRNVNFSSKLSQKYIASFYHQVRLLHVIGWTWISVTLTISTLQNPRTSDFAFNWVEI